MFHGAWCMSTLPETRAVECCSVIGQIVSHLLDLMFDLDRFQGNQEREKDICILLNLEINQVQDRLHILLRSLNYFS